MGRRRRGGGCNLAVQGMSPPNVSLPTQTLIWWWMGSVIHSGRKLNFRSRSVAVVERARFSNSWECRRKSAIASASCCRLAAILTGSSTALRIWTNSYFKQLLE